MYGVRRTIFLFIVFLLGVILGDFGKEIIWITGVPFLVTLVMIIDDKKYQQIKNNA